MNQRSNKENKQEQLRKNNEYKFKNLKENKNMQLTPNLKYETKLKQKNSIISL